MLEKASVVLEIALRAVAAVNCLTMPESELQRIHIHKVANLSIIY